MITVSVPLPLGYVVLPLASSSDVQVPTSVLVTIADAVRDSVRKLLGGKDVPADAFQDRRDPAHYRDMEDDPWRDEDRRWQEEEVYTPAREASLKGNRWRNAMSTALQAAMWFVKNQPRRRPVLTTLAVTVVAGVTGFVAGPMLAAGAGVFASLAGLLFAA